MVTRFLKKKRYLITFTLLSAILAFIGLEYYLFASREKVSDYQVKIESSIREVDVNDVSLLDETVPSEMWDVRLPGELLSLQNDKIKLKLIDGNGLEKIFEVAFPAMSWSPKDKKSDFTVTHPSQLVGRKGLEFIIIGGKNELAIYY